MKKYILIIIVLLFCSGCISATERRQQIVYRFQVAYPNTWQQKLLEYDIQQTEIQRQNSKRAFDMWNENVQRQLDRQSQYYIIQPQQQRIRTNNFGQIIDNIGRTLPYKY